MPPNFHLLHSGNTLKAQIKHVLIIQMTKQTLCPTVQTWYPNRFPANVQNVANIYFSIIRNCNFFYEISLL